MARRLRVGAAVGVGEGTEERVEAMVKAGVDAIVVDTAHGHSKGVINRVRWVKQNYPQVDVVEKIGIERAWTQIQQADIIILLTDITCVHETEHQQRDRHIETQLQQRLRYLKMHQ